jgi:hypothetical protein
MRIDRVVNHQVDAFIAAYATYFDGVLSEDKQLNSTYEMARDWISALDRAL